MEFWAADWYKEHAFYRVLQHSFSEGVIPFHTDLAFHGTDRFLALPEIILSPQIFVLLFTDKIGLFVLVHYLLLYTIGFLGCVALQRHFRLSAFSFTLLTGLFSFNGYVTSHLAVGHTMWGGYFFLPLYFLILISMIEGRLSSRGGGLGMAMILALVLLQGSLHIFVGCVIYLLVFSTSNRRVFGFSVWALSGAVLLSLYRLVPALISFRGYRQIFQSGYPTMNDLFDAFMVIKYPSIEMIGGLTGGLYWWELDVFIGVLGFVFLLYFGLYRAWREEWGRLKFSEFNIANGVVFAFAVSHFFGVIATLPLPFAGVERVPSRFLIFPVVSIMIFSCVRLDAFFARTGRVAAIRWLALFGLIQTWFELLTHLRFWNIPSVNAALPAVEPLAIAVVSRPQDVVYLTALKISATASAVALVAWCVLLVRSSRDG